MTCIRTAILVAAIATGVLSSSGTEAVNTTNPCATNSSQPLLRGSLSTLEVVSKCSNGCGNDKCNNCPSGCASQSASFSGGQWTCQCQGCPSSPLPAKASQEPQGTSAPFAQASYSASSRSKCSNGCGNDACNACSSGCASSSASFSDGLWTCRCQGCPNSPLPASEGESSADPVPTEPPRASQEPQGSSEPPAQASHPSSSDWKAVLQRQNMYRCMHGVPPLSWSADLAQIAQKYADHQHGHMEHSQWAHEHGLGENLYWSSPTMNPVKGVDSWYNEIKLTNDGKVSAFSSGTGHYTQVVWRSTTEVGCGQKDGLLVCNYKPSGNMAGEFSANVNSPVKSKSACP